MKTQSILLAMVLMLSAAMMGCSESKVDLAVKGISISKKSVTLKPDAKETLTVTFFPENAANKNLTWSSSDSSVASVTDGVITAIKPGSATITATTEDGGEKATCSVTVALGDPINVIGKVDGVWAKYSVINVTGHIEIPQDKSLTIEEGVEIIVSTSGQPGDVNNTKLEFMVNGNLYCLGTEESPIIFTVPVAERTVANTFGRLWGGIIGSETCGEMLLDNVIIEYTGAVTTVTSPSVVAGLFKPAGGEAMVAFNTNNPSGKYVIVNSTFRNTGEDAIYVQGGECIFAHNTFHANGEAGGEAINVKAGCKVDAAFNLMYSPNTNALKLSNAGADGGQRFQAQINGYNNTIVNSGWRRDPNKPKGGCVWAEAGCLVNIYNNLIVNSMFAVKAPKFGVDATDGPDLNSKIDYNFYTSGAQQSTIAQHLSNGTVTAYDGFKDGIKDVVYGKNDVRSQAAGDPAKDPKFVNFPLSENPLLSYDNFNSAWNFHLQAGSPAAQGAKTDFTPYFSQNGITINGKVYKSPAPASYFGAFSAQ